MRIMLVAWPGEEAYSQVYGEQLVYRELDRVDLPPGIKDIAPASCIDMGSHPFEKGQIAKDGRFTDRELLSKFTGCPPRRALRKPSLDLYNTLITRVGFPRHISPFCLSRAQTRRSSRDYTIQPLHFTLRSVPKTSILRKTGKFVFHSALLSGEEKTGNGLER